MSGGGSEGRQFHSRFGGMWIDRTDFSDELTRRLREGIIPAHLEAPIRQFEQRGVVILERAASEEALQAYETAFTTALREGHDRLIALVGGGLEPTTARMDPRMVKFPDCFAVLPGALDLLASLPLIEFLEAIFGERPLLMQSLGFEMSSEQPLHQDTAYVIVDERPMELAACWIALEDVKPGSGPLHYMIGGHRLPDLDFGEKKHYGRCIDGIRQLDKWERWIVDEGEKRGFEIEEFMAKRGDILIWHADLPHGGLPVTDPTLTRRSLVGHYCPESATPLGEIPPRMKHGRMSYSCSHYDLSMEKFDEEAYLEDYADAAAAVRAGYFRSGRQHFDEFGRAEGRAPNRYTIK